jgi:hypothetical protein
MEFVCLFVCLLGTMSYSNLGMIFNFTTDNIWPPIREITEGRNRQVFLYLGAGVTQSV